MSLFLVDKDKDKCIVVYCMRYTGTFLAAKIKISAANLINTPINVFTSLQYYLHHSTSLSSK